MHRYKNISALSFVAILAGCNDNAPPTPAAPSVEVTPKPAPVARTAEQLDAMLMAAVFGEGYRADTKEAVAELKNPGSELKSAHHVKAIKHAVLATGETVLLVRSLSKVEAGGSQDAWLGVYFLREKNGKWNLIRRHDNLTLLDRDALGKVSWVKLGKGKEGMAVQSSLKWDDCAEEGITLYDLGDTALRELNPFISTRSVATGEECNRAYSDSRWSIEGKWRTAAPKKDAPFDDIIVDFSGQVATPPHDMETGNTTGPRVTKKVNVMNRYAYDAKLKQYALVEGKDPVPQDPADYDG